MARCKWCGEKFDQDELTARGYCEDCNKELRDTIKSLKKQLDDLYEAASPDLSSEEKQQIIDSTYSVYSKLKSYKDKKVAFFTSDIEEPRKRVYRKLNIDPPPAPKTPSRFVGVITLSIIVLFGISIYCGLFFVRGQKEQSLTVSETVQNVNVPVSSSQAKTKSFSKQLCSGHYTVGIDIPEGTYKFTAVKWSGNVYSSNYSFYGDGINEIMGVPSSNEYIDIHEEKIEDIYLPEGEVLSISGVVIGATARDASAEPLEKRDQEISETVTLKNGVFVSGTDFEPGVYCIEAVSGGGNVYTEDGDDYGINAIIGTSDQNTNGTDLYEQQFNNVSLPDRCILYVSDVEIKLTPSK